MADAPQMERPGVEVIQQFMATSATILRPSLQACVVGPCRQVVEAITDEGTLNAEALVSVPARLTTPFVVEPYQYAGIEGLTLQLAVNRGPARAIDLPAGGAVTPAKLVDAVNTAALSGLVARVETSGDQQRAVLETTSRGDNACLQVVAASSPALLTELDFTAGQTVTGAAGYDNAIDFSIQAPDYPDPRTNREDLHIDPDSVRVFLSPGGGSPIEVSRHEAFVAGGYADVSVVDDGDGDSLSPYIEIDAVDFGEPSAAAVLEGTAAPADFATEVHGRVLRMSLDGAPYQTLLFPDTVLTVDDIATAINALWGAGTATVDGGFVDLGSPSQFGGAESSVRIDKQASSPELLSGLGYTGAGGGLESSDVVHGAPYAPLVGDELWVDGVKLGEIVEVIASPSNRLRLAVEQLLTFEGTSYRVLGKGLDNNVASATRPSSNLVVDQNTGSVMLKAGLFQDNAGGFVTAKGLTVYLAYDALRLDVAPSKKSSDFNLLRIGKLAELEAQLAPVDTQNPLALGMYFALLNAPGLEVTGVGIDEVNDSAPEGTADAYARSFEYLESKDVYAIAPLTHSADVGSIGAMHASVMSEPSNGLERIVILNPVRPDRRSSTLVASGARANVNGPPSDIVETGLANLQALLAVAGKPGPAYAEEDDLYIAFEGDANHYLIQGVNGGAVTVNNGPLQDNLDGYYLDGGGQPLFEDIVVDRPFTVAIRGQALTNLTDEAASYGDLGRGYRNKRVLLTMPDTVKATLDGLESAIPGYYAAAGLAGRKSGKAPSQPMTEDILAGFTGVVGAQERYSEPQLRMIAGGGVWILYQESDGQPVRTRHQLTTDVSTLLTRESSITDALDYAAKTLRSSFRNFIGRFNITTGLIEALNLVCDGVRDFFVQNGVFAAFDVISLEQSETNPDELSIIADVTTLKPLNKIRVVMRVT